MIPWWIRRYDTHNVLICHPVIVKSKYDKNINIFPPRWLNYDTQTKAKPLFSHIVHQSPLFDHWNICVQRGGALQSGCGWNAVSQQKKVFEWMGISGTRFFENATWLSEVSLAFRIFHCSLRTSWLTNVQFYIQNACLRQSKLEKHSKRLTYLLGKYFQYLICVLLK